MAEGPGTVDMQKALFSNLLIMLSTSAMQQLGKLVDPMSGKPTVSLEGAQVAIDTLEMLQVRTKGNLDAGEEKMLKDLLATLQMNYVETAREQSEKPAPPAGPAADEGEAAPETPADEPTVETPGAADKKDTKFHKSYGE